MSTEEKKPEETPEQPENSQQEVSDPNNPNPNPENKEENPENPENPEQNENQNNENEENIENQNENQNDQQNAENADQQNAENADQKKDEQKDKKKETKGKTKEELDKEMIDELQRNIQKMTKSIEHEKIQLRIKKERLTQRQKTYNELQGKPVEKTAEEKDKELREHRKAVKNHKYTDGIERKKGKEKELADNAEKERKEHEKNKAEFEKLTFDINELIVSNNELKEKIKDLRKRKNDAIKQRDDIREKNEEKKKDLEDLRQENEDNKKNIRHKDLRKAVKDGDEQQKDFEGERNDLEIEYQKLREEYIKRERETKKENAKKRQMALLSSGQKSQFKGSQDKDVEKQLKMIADEEIMDRTPMLDLCNEKWREINKLKKDLIDAFEENSTEIKKTFEELTNYLGLDSFEELPIVYKKTEEQMANIGFYKEKLDLQIDELEQDTEKVVKEIEKLTGKKRVKNDDKEKFIAEKEYSQKVTTDLIKDFELGIKKRKKLFKTIQPATDKYLSKLSKTYLSDFVYDKENVDSTKEYNEKTVSKFLSNVQDYFMLVQEWEEAVNKEKKKTEEVSDVDKLRDDMAQKLGGFEKSRLMNKLYSSMKSDYKSHAKNLEDIIKEYSVKFADEIQYPNKNSTTKSKTLAGTLNKSKESGNYRYGNDSGATYQTSNKNKSGVTQDNERVAEAEC